MKRYSVILISCFLLYASAVSLSYAKNFTTHQSAGSFHISQYSNGEWNEIYKEGYSVNYQTKVFSITPENGEVQLRIVQKTISYGDIDLIQLTACGQHIIPQYARYIDSWESVLGDIIADDHNVAINHEKPIEIKWTMPLGCISSASMSLKANEYESPEANAFRFPTWGVPFQSYTFRNNGQFILDGKLSEVDGHIKPDYSPFWLAGTGHPSNNTHIYMRDDKDYVYIAADITLDNSNEFGADWYKIIALNTVSGKEKEYRIDDYRDEFGTCSFGLTTKVSYRHQTCEARIPKSDLTSGKLDFVMRYYGTGGGADPSVTIDSVSFSDPTSDTTPSITGNAVAADGASTITDVNFGLTQVSLLHEFTGGSDGESPQGGFARSGSVLYGTASGGGVGGNGVIFSVATDGTGYTVLHEFTGGTDDGAGPLGSLILSGSTLYGMTSGGGDSFVGTVFSIDTDGTDFTLLHEFAGGTNDGSNPHGTLTISGSILYGMTNGGGDEDMGTIFSINTDGTNHTLLHEFVGGINDGSSPRGALTISSSTLYGMTYGGGDESTGTIFSIDTDGTDFTLLHEFAGGTNDGSNPLRDLTLVGSTLYGLTEHGGDTDDGTIFSIGTNGAGYSVLHEFSGGNTDGEGPHGSLTASGSTLYGTTRYGGDIARGVLFSIETDGSDFDILHDFAGGVDDGGEPFDNLTLSGSTLYGTTRTGGDNNGGTIFSLPISGDVSTLYEGVCSADDGSFDELSEAFTCTTSSLASGTYQMYIRATDGSTFGTDNSAQFEVIALTPPSLIITPVSDPTGDTTPTLSGNATDDGTVASAEFQMDSTSGSWTACTANDGTFDEADENFSCTADTLIEGEHTMYVRSTDNASNTSSNESDTFTVDASGPAVNLSALSPDPTDDQTPTLSGTATDTYSAVSTVQYQVDSTSGTWHACTASDGTFDELSEAFTCTASTLTQGSHTLYVRATDAVSQTTDAGDYDSDTFVIDLAGPSITLDAISPDPTVNTRPSITGTAVDGGLTIDYVQFQMDRTSGSWTSCTADDDSFDELSEEFTCTLTSSLTQAAHTVYVRSADSNGNTSQTSDDFTVDRTPSYLTADYPNEGVYIRLQRPTFKFRASSGSTSQFDSYTLDVHHEDGTGFTISGIPTDGPNVSTSRYTITSTGYGDSNDSNDYIYITTKSSADWSDNANNGLLKEGKNVWTMTAQESGGNSISTGHTFYVDVTKPVVKGVSTATLGAFEGYLLSTQQRPRLIFSLSDNLTPFRYTVDIYKQNYFLALETSRTLVSSESVIPFLSDGQLSIDLSFVPTRSLPYGKYIIVLTGYDKAENPSNTSVLSLQLLPREKAEELLKKPVKETLPLSLPELEKRAILRRQKEAQALEKIVADVKRSADNLDTRLVTAATYAFKPIQTVTSAARGVVQGLVINLDRGLSRIAELVSLPKIAQSTRIPLEEKILTLRKAEHAAAVHNTPEIPALTISEEKVKQRFKERDMASNKKVQEVFSAASTTLHGFQEPVKDVKNFTSRVSAGAQTFYAIVFDKEPTKISHVTIEDIGTDYVTISWETNHPATGKVNFGPNLTYGKEVHLSKYEKLHTAKLTGLKPGQKYFFEVMSHGKNYTYDSFYTVETIIEEKE